MKADYHSDSAELMRDRQLPTEWQGEYASSSWVYRKQSCIRNNNMSLFLVNYGFDPRFNFNLVSVRPHEDRQWKMVAQTVSGI